MIEKKLLFSLFSRIYLLRIISLLYPNFNFKFKSFISKVQEYPYISIYILFVNTIIISFEIKNKLEEISGPLYAN